ncbi:zeta toxin family protein [Variovorax guangxiensis]|uniref:zeta toxin family protein n=1 Tax=Variovorax guangxiensis TaxID=1775474 RepID=UPI00285C39BF|nr:zeta toxin family protein [Variovorax guangxiensis]MDR6860974.1 putative ABC-type ATPase [Variovorax guangxiensis]
MPARIFVLAGVNGAGKSSVGGAALLQKKVDYFNPDLAARALLDANPGLSAEAANAQAWEFGRQGLERALAQGLNFAFETTLGARTLPQMLLDGARQGAQVHLWYAGLSSPELHLQRVRARVAAGGHDIPEAKIRERYESSRANLIRLLPHLASLRVYDNSAEGDPKAGHRPQPLLLLHMEGGRIVAHVALDQVPQWAKPVMAVALRLPGGAG